MWTFGQSDNSIHGVPQESAGPFQIVVNVPKQFVLVLHLIPDIYRERFENVYLVFEFVG